MFIYEMHQHTWPCSHCGKADPVKLVHSIKEAGFAGVVITNHFFHGNTGIDRELPWNEFIKCYEDDYLAAKAEGDKEDIDVIFGVEEHVGESKEVLLYGITPEFLYAHPEMKETQELEYISKIVREYGALVFQAHPYRSRSYIVNPDKNVPVEFLDGFESYNASNPPEENVRAQKYAEEHGLLVCAGSDAHGEEFPSRYGIMCSHRIKDSLQLAETLRSKDYSLYLMPAE